MTNQQGILESAGQVSGDVGGQANGNQEPTGQQTSQADGGFSQAQLQQLENILGPLVQKQVQSTKDRRIAKNEAAIGSLEERVRKYVQYSGGQFDERAWRDVQVDEILQGQQQPGLQQQPQQQASQATEPQPQQATEGLDIPTLVNSMGLDPNRSDVINAIAQHSSDPVSLVRQLTSIAASGLKPASKATIAQQGGPGSTTTIQQQQQLENELTELMANPRENWPRIQEIKKGLGHARQNF